MWEELGAYAMRNGNYSISKAKVKSEWVFSLWQITLQNRLGNFAKYKEAQAAHEKILSKEK